MNDTLPADTSERCPYRLDRTFRFIRRDTCPQVSASTALRPGGHLGEVSASTALRPGGHLREVSLRDIPRISHTIPRDTCPQVSAVSHPVPPGREIRFPHGELI